MKKNGVFLEIPKFIKIFFEWMWEIAAFMLLPLIIYIVVFWSLDVQLSQLSKLPEWMFITIILFGDTLKKSIFYYKQSESEFETNAVVMISWAIIGISIASVILTFSIIAGYKEFELPTIYYTIQSYIFILGVLSSAIYAIIIKTTTKL